MMSNSMKYIQVNISDMCRILNLSNIYTKDNRLKANVFKNVEKKIKEKIKYLGFEFQYELSVNAYNNEFRLTFDWDKMKFGRTSNYENVYTFDNTFAENELHPLTRKLIVITGIAWFASD
jgi:hypothetical protein